MSRTTSNRRPPAPCPKSVPTCRNQQIPCGDQQCSCRGGRLVRPAAQVHRAAAQSKKQEKPHRLKSGDNETRARHHELNTKRRGELAELAFTLKAARLNFGVSKPYGDSERYDVILDARTSIMNHLPNWICHPEDGQPMSAAKRRSRPKDRTSTSTTDAAKKNGTSAGIVLDTLAATSQLHRIQIKCSTQLFEGLYRVNAHRRTNGRAVPYLPTEIDFIAAYIIPEDTWYIIPIQAVRGTSLLFRRKRDRKPGLYNEYKEAWHLLRGR